MAVQGMPACVHARTGGTTLNLSLPHYSRSSRLLRPTRDAESDRRICSVRRYGAGPERQRRNMSFADGRKARGGNRQQLPTSSLTSPCRKNS